MAYPHRTVVDTIVDSGGGTGSLTVIDAAGRETVTDWSDVHHRARRMASTFTGRGIGPGSRVGLLGDTSLDLVVTLQAVWLTGAAATVLPLPTRDPERAYLASLAGIVADAGLDLVVVDAAAPVVVATLSAATAVVALSDVVARSRDAAPAEPVRPDPGDLAVLQYTSGSTRAPRGVPVSHANLAANLHAIMTDLDHDAGHPSVTLSWLPLYHDMGLIAFCALPMVCGCPLVLQATAVFAQRPASWLEAIAHYRATATGAPNFAYRLMTRLLKAGLAGDLSSVRLLLSGAEPIDAVSMATFAAVASSCGLDPLTLTPAYGLAESTLTVAQSRWGSGIRVDRVDPDALETRGVAVPVTGAGRYRPLVRLGRPIPTTEVRVVDPVTGERVGPRTVGRIEVRGPSVVGRYWGEPTPPVGAWLSTGDLGYLTGTEPDFGLDGTPGPGRAGELVVCGREKDVLFAAGRNVFPQDVEAAAAEVPGVRPGGVIAFGVPHDEGDRLVLAVESRAADPAAVRGAVAAAVVAEVGLAPADVAIMPPGHLPKTTSGKLRRAEARRRYLAGQLTPDSAPPASPEVLPHSIPTSSMDLNAPPGPVEPAGPTHVLEESR